MTNKPRDAFGGDLEDKDLRRIAAMIANLPDREPPGDLIHAVMARIQPKKSSRLAILWRRMSVPVSFVPLRIVSAAASLALVLLVVILLAGRGPDQTSVTSLPRAENGSERTVVFTLNMPDASRVELIGTFNQWKPGDSVMTWDESRKAWVLSLDLTKGRYEYAFLVDGEKVVPDPDALVYRDDGFGNKNSILIVERNNGHEAGI